MSPTYNSDGSVISSALDGVEDFSHAQDFFYSDSMIYPGQILKIYPKDDPENNTSGTTGDFTLYDVIIKNPEGGSQIVKSCRAIQPFFGGGFNNFLEVLPTNPGPKDYLKDPNLKPGTMVAVAFLFGQRAAPIILGALPHDNPVAVRARPTKDKGVHLEGEFQGLNFQITNDGALKITFNSPKDNSGTAIKPNAAPTTLEIDSSGNVDIKTNASQQVKMDREGKKINVVNGQTSIVLDQNGAVVTTTATTVNVNASADCNIKTGGKTTIKAGGKCTVDAAQIELNGAAGDVLTTQTDELVDDIYGRSTIGVKNVKAG